MAELNQQELAFYTALYKAISDPKVNDLIAKYAEKQYNNSLKSLRTKKDNLYDYGYANGSLDIWNAVLNLKDTLIKILQNV